MKKSIHALSLLFLILFLSCSRDSNTENNSIQGQWKLVNVTGTFAGVNHNFPSGEIIWDFNPITQTVTVVNNNTNPNLFDVMETGVYSFQLNSNPEILCGESIVVDTVELGCYVVENNTLYIDQSIADGFRMTFTR